jgi:hypothetical protein
MIASDITRRKVLILSRDLADFNVDINTFPIARAARMSMIVP